MTRLEDLRRRFPVADRAAHRRAYAEAERSARLGAAVHTLREEAGWTRAELASRVGVSEDAVVLAEEGDAAAAGGFAPVFAVLARRMGALATGTGSQARDDDGAPPSSPSTPGGGHDALGSDGGPRG